MRPQVIFVRGVWGGYRRSANGSLRPSTILRKERHAMEVDYHGFRRDLRGELLKAGVDIGKPPMGYKGRYKSFEMMSPSPAAVGQ